MSLIEYNSKNDFCKFNPGDTIRVYIKIFEENRERLQQFEGIVIKKKGVSTNNETFTVRKVSYGVGVERIFPIFSPIIHKIEVIKKGSVRRSKLYYLKNKYGKSFRVKEKLR